MTIQVALQAIGEATKLLARRTAANRLTMFHGTASGPNNSRLRSILKHGLVPTAPKAWAADPNAKDNRMRSRAAYGGTYFAENPRVAFSSVHQSRGSDGSQYPVIVTATIQPRAALPDEDDYVGLVDHAYRYAIKTGDSPSTDAYYYLCLFVDSFDERSHGDEDLEEVHQRFADSLSDNLKRYGVIIELQRLRKFTDPLFDAEVVRRVSNQPDDWYGFKKTVQGRALDYFKFYKKTPLGIDQLPAEIQKQPTYEEGEAKFREALDALTKATRRLAIGLETHAEDADVRFRHTLRVMEPVTFRGRNKITSVVSLPNYYSRSTGTPVTVVSHYGDPTPVVKYLESEGYTVEVISPKAMAVDDSKPEATIASGKSMNTLSAMAVLLRQVSDHDWGFFSREDDRLHVQTVDRGFLYGPKKAKVWLENKGQRSFEVAEMGSLSPKKIGELKKSIDDNKELIESEWIARLIDTDKIRASMNGDSVTITLYPKTHNEYTRTVDLRELFPAVEDFSSWVAGFLTVFRCCALVLAQRSRCTDIT